MDIDRANHRIKKFGLAALQRSLRGWRDELQMSQQELARQSGVSQQTISMLENRGRKLTAKTFARIEAALTDAYEKREAENKVQSSRNIGLRAFLQKDYDSLQQLRQRMFNAPTEETYHKVKDRLIEAQFRYIKLLEEPVKATKKDILTLKARMKDYRDLLNLQPGETTQTEGDGLTEEESIHG